MAGPDAMASYYAARAGEYDSVYAKPERQGDLRAIEQWLPTRFSGETVLEIACGTGHWTRFLAPVVRSLVAIDAAPETLAIARQRIAADHVVFRVGDAYAPPIERPPFGAAFSGFWFSHVPLDRQHEFLQRLHPALRPGARVVLLDNLFVAGSSSPIAEQDAAGNTYQRRTLRDGSTHRILKNFPSEPALRALVETLRGTSPQYVRWQHYWALEYRTAA